MTLGRCVLNCILTQHDAPPTSSKRTTARATLEVVTPACRAISASDIPNSFRPRFAIAARRLQTFLRRLPPLSSFGLILPLAHSSSMILIMEAYRGCAEENRVRPDRSPFYVSASCRTSPGRARSSSRSQSS